MYAINEKLRKGHWAENLTATDSSGQQDKYNLACMEGRLEECIKAYRILAMYDENGGKIVYTVGEERGEDIHVSGLQRRHSETTIDIMQRTKPVLICDHTRRIDDFGTKLRTGIEYVGREMGWNMDLKKAGWVCQTSGIKRL